ncbi:hypothetical protein OG474_18125 [Kribbella sp. NBC_01505]|uniref:hypothetical protein n=1 Tax=Kribbella sp. NBC_01505 TaxID=2903580 RepID=UPI00386E863E
MHIVGGYVIATPTMLGPDDLPRPLRTISHCLLPDLPRAPDADWFVDRTTAEATVKATSVDADVLAVGIEESLAQTLRTDRADWWAANPALAKSRRGKSPAIDPGADEFFHLLDQKRPLDATVLGFELVGLESDFTFHSWHCFPYEAERHALDITLAPDGLLADHDDALRALDHLRANPPREIPWTIVAVGR